MEVICINTNFPLEHLQFWKKYGVEPPQQDSIYNIRDIVINSNGKTGLLLEELVNPKVPINHPLIPGEVTMMEPNFYEKRFTTLLGEQISLAEVKQFVKNKSLV